MKRWKDEEDPAEPRCCMNISQRMPSRLGCIFSWLGTCLFKVFRKILDNLADLKWKVGCFFREKNRLVIRPWWDIVLVISCVIAVSLDPLFFYIPTINEEEKCLEMDTKLRTASTIAEIWWSLATDFLCILPAPQVLIVVIFYKNFGYLNNSTIMNALLLIQYAPRIYQLNQSFDNLKHGIGLWVKIVFNFFQYILACHILGASWFFFSIQREMLCWYQVCVKHKTCGTYFKCNDVNSSRNITKLVELCPMNPPNSTVYDFGIFVNPLGTSSRTPINFSTKFSYSFWWGVRNLSNFGTNLQTSTYLWENWFASLISIIGLLLFLYLIGNNVQTYMQMKTKKAEEEAERLRLEAERIRRQQTRINLWMERHDFPSFARKNIEEKMTEKYKENKEANIDNVPTLLSFITSGYKRYARVKICQKMLENVPLLKDMDLDVLLTISRRMEIVVYPENTWIVEMDEALDRMVFITEGTMGIYTARSDCSPSAVIQGSLEKCSIYGHERLLRWVLSPNPDLDRLPISKEAVKCSTKVEGFVLTADDLKTVLFDKGVIGENCDDAEVSDSSLRSSFLVATAVSRFRRRLRRKKPALHLDFDPSSFKGL
ncbi:hypothetical protein ACLB2K_069601 [Fragaria x ananassa]